MRPINAESSNAPPVQIASSSTAVTLAEAKKERLGLTIFNDSTQVLHVKLGTGASATDKNVEIGAGGYYEVPFNYVGIVTGLWDSANGFAYVSTHT